MPASAPSGVHLDLQLRLRPSSAFQGILAELNGLFPDWSDGSYDWANQTVDFLHAPEALPDFGAALWRTPLSQRALQDLLHLNIALLSGQYPAVRQYLQGDHFAFVIGYPRSGGSYLTKELLRGLGFEHTQVSEVLAHDGFPELREHWYGPGHGGTPYFHLQEAIAQVAEFLTVPHLYYRHQSSANPDGRWLIPKKMHKLIYWAGSFKMLLGRGNADYLITLRHPAPTAISIYEKCQGLPADGRFPQQPRCAIEKWIREDLTWLGHSDAAISRMDYFTAVCHSWTAFYTRLAGSGLLLSEQDAVRWLPYGKETLEGVVQHYRQRCGSARAIEPFQIHDKGVQVHPDWMARGDRAVAHLRDLWAELGIPFPELSAF